MWQNGGSISLGSSVYRLQLTVQRMSAGDGWARISTIKMVSHPSGQENDAKPKREVGRVVQPQSNWQVERLWRGSVWDIYSRRGIWWVGVGRDYWNTGTVSEAGSGFGHGFGFGFAGHPWCWVTSHSISLRPITHAIRPHKYICRKIHSPLANAEFSSFQTFVNIRSILRTRSSVKSSVLSFLTIRFLRA